MHIFLITIHSISQQNTQVHNKQKQQKIPPTNIHTHDSLGHQEPRGSLFSHEGTQMVESSSGCLVASSRELHCRQVGFIIWTGQGQQVMR